MNTISFAFIILLNVVLWLVMVLVMAPVMLVVAVVRPLVAHAPRGMSHSHHGGPTPVH